MASRMVLIITVSIRLFLMFASLLLIVTRILYIRPIKSMPVASLAKEVAQLEARSKSKIKFKLNLDKLIWALRRVCTV